ncbi:MAG: DUF2723 domain-containing protein [Endomicrobiia bacterium]
MIYLVLFLNIFLIYLYCSFPTIAAYRDSGEMATVSYILGIPHPPGYPLYTILSYLLSRMLKFGNFAYRVNVLSGIFSALTGIILFHLFNKFTFYILPKKENEKFFWLFFNYMTILCFSLSYLQWYLSVVSEMYTLNTLFATFMIFLTFLYYTIKNNKVIYLLFFIFGLGITNRLDLILYSPLILFILIDHSKFRIDKKVLMLLTLFLLGLSCYMYLPIRSSNEPLIDWNNPQKLDRFWASLTRKTHGSTLDLISSGYKPFENFKDGMIFYFRRTLENLGLIGIIPVVLGINLKSHFGISLFLSWFLSSVYFIYKANMPPNPHALAILEAHFLLPNLIVWVWFILGITYVYKKIKLKYFIFVAVSFILVFNIFKNHKKLNKRNNFYAYDYTVNILRTLPNKSIVVVKEDVQLFSLWYSKFVESKRKDVYVIAAGLAGSSWYQEMTKRFFEDEIFLLPLTTSDNWSNFIDKNLKLGYKIFVTYDVELPEIKNFILKPYGLVLRVLPFQENLLENFFTDFFFEFLYIFRGDYTYNLEFDFFSSDLVEDYSKSLLNSGHWLTKYKLYNSKKVENFYKHSIFMNSVYPYGYFELGYLYYLKNLLKDSYIWYKIAAKKFEEYIELAYKYKAFKEVIDEIKSNTANCYLHLGVVAEKLNNLETSIEFYNRALYFNPYLADAYYNLAVVYWKKLDWQKVRYYLQKTLIINPYHSQAKYFIDKLPK